jgi:hypothetical protein
MKRIFNLILTLTVMLTMAQTAWANDPVTKTISFSTAERSSDQLSIIATDPDDNTSKSVITANGTTNDIGITSTLKISNKTSSYSTGTEVSLLISPYVNGKVTKIEFTSVMRGARVNNGTFSMSIDGMKYNGTDATLTGNISGYESVTFISNSSEGIAGNLTMRLGIDAVFQINKSSCQMIITYIPSAAPTHSHNFSFNAVGNTLTATCGHSDGLDCSLADANYQATLTLSPSVDTYYRPNSTYSAKHNLTAFNALTGLNATATDITYVNNATGDNLGTAAPTTAGNYTASVTVTVGGTDYTLTTDFKVNTENSINNNIRQISLNKTNAANDEEITITFTPRSHELVNTLTVTGATTDMSIGNGITKVDEYTYTFLMPYEEVTVGATFKSSDASLYKYAITTDITGSGAVDYNAEEYLGVGDVITITFMPYLQGNLEVGSVVLEGLTVTGATTNMNVGNGITDNGDNTYTFTMPDENVTVTAKAYLSADAILAGTINEPIYIKQGNGIQIGCNNKWTYVNDGALPLVIPDGNTLRLAGGTDVRLDLADKNAIACEGDAIVELIPNEVSNEIWIGDRPERNSGKATIKVGPAGKTLTIRVADESTETVHLSVKSISQYDRNCDVIGCDEGGSCGSIVVESGQVESRVYFNHSGRAFRTTDGTITFGYKYPNDKIYFDGGSEGTVKIEDGKQFHSYTDYNTKYSGTINLQGMNSFDARPDKYTVNYCEHDGQNQKVRYVAHGMPFSFKAATPADEGHEFQGWKNMVTDEVYEHDFIVTNDLNIIAQWKAVDFQKKGNLAKASEEDEAFYWSTFYCGDATYKLGEKACAYTATYDGGQIVLHKLGTVIPADKAVVIASENELTDMTVVAGDTPAEYEVENDLKGYDYRYYVDAQNSSVAYYVLGKYKNAEDGVEFGFQRYQGDYLPAHKAFLNAGGAANARGMRMVFAAEDITGIENLNMNVSERNDTWYTLDGRKLDKKPTTRGIYINRGNKVVIK